MALDITLIVAAIIVLIVLSAFFNGSETALTAASRARMHALEQEGNSKAATVNKLLRSPEKMIGAILIGNTLVDVLASALASGLAGSREMWERSVIAGVHPLNAFLLMLGIVLAWQWSDVPGVRGIARAGGWWRRGRVRARAPGCA